jgi:hypothetical protein
VHASEVAAVAVPLLPGARPRRALAVIVVDEPLRVRASGRRERTHRRGGARISIAGERRRIGAGGSQQQAPIDIRPDRTIGSGVAEPTVEARSARTAGVDLSAVQGALLPYAESRRAIAADILDGDVRIDTSRRWGRAHGHLRSRVLVAGGRRRSGDIGTVGLGVARLGRRGIAYRHPRIARGACRVHEGSERRRRWPVAADKE